MALQGHTFSKQERICDKKDIAALLAAGRWCREGVLKACYAENGLDFSRVLISVPKRYFKRAVKRNLLKRRIREAYRLQKGLLVPVEQRSLAGMTDSAARGFDILFQYDAADVAEFAAIFEDVAAVLRRIAK